MVSRSIWTKERSFTWWNRIVHGSFTKEDWLKNFPMSKGTFLYLCQELRHTISRHDTQMRKVLPCEMRVAITLWQLGTNDSYRTFRHLFGVSRSSLCYIVKEVCQAIVSKLLLIYIRIPEGDALKEVVRQFQSQYNFEALHIHLQQETSNLDCRRTLSPVWHPLL